MALTVAELAIHTRLADESRVISVRYNEINVKIRKYEKIDLLTFVVLR